MKYTMYNKPEKNIDNPTYEKHTASEKVVVSNCDKLNLRDAPSLDGNVISILDAGDEVYIDDVENGWAHVIFENLDGYVMSGYIE